MVFYLRLFQLCEFLHSLLTALYERMIDDEKSFLLPQGYAEPREVITEDDNLDLDPRQRRRQSLGLSEINPKVMISVLS